jgi:hypothetical protein
VADHPIADRQTELKAGVAGIALWQTAHDRQTLLVGGQRFQIAPQITQRVADALISDRQVAHPDHIGVVVIDDAAPK